MTLPPDDDRTVLVSSKGVPPSAPPPASPAPAAAASVGSSHTPATTAASASHTPATTPGSGGATSSGTSDDAPHNALAVGTRLGEFEITGLLGEGGFGIVYLAYDSSLERHVALKEYMPSAFASRTMMSEVRVKSERHLETFQAGLRSFVNEARLLAQFDHPSLIKVYRFWEANGTAYMIMPYYQGITLKQALRERSEPVDEAWLKSLLAPLLDTLSLIHDQQCFHRDIAPDNIMMIDECQPVLLDFGAARRAISGMDQAFTVILKQGYAPIEQYAETPGMDQGAWTDLFALASVVHYAIDGKPPPPAVGRAISDPYVPLAQRYAGKFSAQFLQAIDQALSVRPEQRPQSAAQMRTLLGLGHAGATMYMPPPASVKAPPPKPSAAVPEPAAKRAEASAGGNKGMIIGGAVAATLLVAAGVGYTMMGKPAAPVAVADKAPAVASAPVASAPVTSAPLLPPVAQTAPEAAPVPTPAPVQATPRSFDPMAELRSVVAGASPERQVVATGTAATVRINQDPVQFSVTASHAGYVYVHMLGTAPDNLFLLFPNSYDKKNQIKAGETLMLPRKGWKFQAAGPAGADNFVVIVSDSPREFDAVNGVLKKPFLEFSTAGASRALQSWTSATPLLAGTAKCDAAAACSPLYGAAIFSIEETAK